MANSYIRSAKDAYDLYQKCGKLNKELNNEMFRWVSTSLITIDEAVEYAAQRGFMVATIKLPLNVPISSSTLVEALTEELKSFGYYVYPGWFQTVETSDDGKLSFKMRIAFSQRTAEEF